MKILVVDDKESNRRFYDLIVHESPNSKLKLFSNAENALQWCAAGGDPDLAIVEYALPGMDGLELLRHLRIHPRMRDVPVLMLGAADQAHVRSEAFSLGALDVLPEPFDEHEFPLRIKNIIALRQRYKEETATADFLASQVKEATLQLVEHERKVIFRLARLAEYRDPETGQHAVRVGHFSRLIAETQGVRPDIVDSIFTAAPLHDVGKVAIPDYILLKRGKLTELEFETMKQHTLLGHMLLADDTSNLLSTAANIALTHHERYDGQGYPSGLKGDAIPLAGRICALADTFDVLTSDRPYKSAWDLDRALAEIDRCRAAQFDPRLVDGFKSVLPEILQIKNNFSDAKTEQAEAALSTSGV